MRLLRLLVTVFVLALIAVGSSQAGPGTVVYKGTTPAIWFWWNDYQIDYVSVTSTDPLFFQDWLCGGSWPAPTPEWKLLSYLDLYFIASGKENFWLKGPQFTRVYKILNPPPPDAFWMGRSTGCEIINGDWGPLVAGGIAEFQWNDHNTCNLGPGKNTWDMRAVGNLSAPLDVCPSGMTHFDFTFHYMLTNDAYVDPATCTLDDPAHIRKVVIRGPDVKCIGK